MDLSTSAFADLGVIPGEFAFCVADPAAHVRLSANRNPDFRWTGVPAGTRSLALICHDPDVPSRGDDVNQEGRSVPASLARVDFFHWVLVDLPPDTPAIARGEFSDGVTPRGKPGPQAPRNARQGTNDYTGWFAGDKDMSGNYFGYDGPCPPWNDELPHRYVFTLYALAVPRLDVAGVFSGADARRAMAGSILAEASVTGRYTLNPAVRLQAGSL
jgi:Raf kinase inhibitor-like YbhB/YbcL family protein